MNRIKAFIDKLNFVLNRYNKFHVLEIIISIFIVLFQYLAFQYSSVLDIKMLFSQKPIIYLFNTTMLFCLTLFFNIFIQKYKISFILSSIFIGVWSIANYFVVKYHGSPLFLSEFSNMTAAMNVAQGYSYAIDRKVIIILFFTFMSLIMCGLRLLFSSNNKWSFKSFLLQIFSFLGLGFIMIFIIIGTPIIKERRNTMTSYWLHGVNPYGMPVCMVEDVDRMINFLTEPEGYDVSFINEFEVYHSKNNKNPDVILILNESFYDMDYYVDTQADVNPMESFYGIENAIYGKAVVPGSGGGTNNSEYELLTSNSISLLTIDSPFNYLDLSSNKNNIVQYFNDEGYQTVGMHCKNGANYSRHIAYPAIGFKNIFFPYPINKNYLDYTHNYYGNRSMLDSDNYKDMNQKYNELDSSSRFIYMLTYQNHGSWDQNDSSYDIVHSSKDFGSKALNENMNEYLTSVKMSSSAFKDLIEQYKNVDRDVIICMVGDHAPAFINEINDNSSSDQERLLKRRSVPYVIWANFPIETKRNAELMGLNTLMPFVLEVGDMPLTTYQKYILDLHDKVPVIMDTETYYSYDKKFVSIKKGDKYYDDIIKYFYLEYNALADKKEYRQELFELR